MATLGSVYHDFPRLAKQSGFYFQLHTGRVNWSEIENVDVSEIIEKRNFQVLEENLINVINCNLEREYDLKILDPNFVKLFKLAQLGVDYLSYCEMYLDKCVVILQEQLTNFQEEVEALKQENERKKEELNKSKRKVKTQNYQCEKCEKVFISDVYLKFHDKRRHSTPSTPSSLDKSYKKCTDNWQQTDDRLKISTSTQTLYFEETSTVTHEDEDRRNIKMEYTIKIEKLEHELKELKERLKKAETSLTERTEAQQSNVFPSPYLPGSMYYNPMLMLLPSYLKQSDNGQYDVNPGHQIPIPVPEISKPNNTVTFSSGNSATVENMPQTQSFSNLNPEPEKVEKSSVTCENTGGFLEYQTTRKEDLEFDKENLEPNLKNIPTNLTKPLPPPRKSKRGGLVNKTPEEDFRVVRNTHAGEEPEGFDSNSITHQSTPIKPYEETDSDIHEASKRDVNEVNKPKTNSTESLLSKTSVESKSFIKKFVGRNSPKLRNLRKSLKKSLTNLYDSVSSTEGHSKKEETNGLNSREAVVMGVENRLWELGVDPEWQGIPKKSMKQKLNILKYKRKLLSKENPMYPIIRLNIEEKIVQKLKNNFGKKNLINKLNKQQSENVEDVVEDKSDFVKVQNSVMYIKSDSDSQSSDSDRNFDETPHRGTSEKSLTLEELNSFRAPEDKFNVKKDREFDFSVFQVGGGSLNNLTEDPRPKQISLVKDKGLQSDSDSDDSFLVQTDDKLFQTFNLSDKNKKIESPETTMNGTTQKRLTFLEKSKEENHNSTLREEELQSRLPTGVKKVFFAKKYSDGIEELSDSPIDDDLWPSKSDSEKDLE